MILLRCLVALALLVLLLDGCSAERTEPISGGAHVMDGESKRKLTIELLGFPGCPATPVLRANLRAALNDVGAGLTYMEVNLADLAPSDMRRGWPAPTVLVNGQDLFGMPPPDMPTMGCRVYDGGVPDAAVLARRIRELLPAGVERNTP